MYEVWKKKVFDMERAEPTPNIWSKSKLVCWKILRRDLRLFLWKVTDKEPVLMMVWMVVERRIRNDANALTTKPFNKEGVEEFNAIHRNLCTYFITWYHQNYLKPSWPKIILGGHYPTFIIMHYQSRTILA